MLGHYLWEHMRNGHLLRGVLCGWPLHKVLTLSESVKFVISSQINEDYDLDRRMYNRIRNYGFSHVTRNGVHDGVKIKRKP